MDDDTKFKCPICEHTKLTDKKDGKNVERYRCNKCFSSVSTTSHTVWHKTHLSPKTREALEQHYDDNVLSNRKIAEKLGISRQAVDRAVKKLNQL